MELDWIMLTNYAEAPPDSGLINMIGAGWDTIHVHGPLEGAPPDVVAVFQFHQTEAGRERALRLEFQDEDGGTVGKIEGNVLLERKAGLPVSWPQGTNIVFPLIGLALRKFGLYRISVLVDDRHLGDREFRIIKEY